MKKNWLEWLFGDLTDIEWLLTKQTAIMIGCPASLVIGKDKSKRIIHFWPDGTTKIHRYDAACMCEINYILDRTRDK